MYAIAISGSPRKGGNTELLLREVLTEIKDAGWETELVKVGGTEIRGCIACEKCYENKDNECAVKKDKFNDIFSKMLKAEAMIRVIGIRPPNTHHQIRLKRTRYCQ